MGDAGLCLSLSCRRSLIAPFGSLLPRQRCGRLQSEPMRPAFYKLRDSFVLFSLMSYDLRNFYKYLSLHHCLNWFSSISLHQDHGELTRTQNADPRPRVSHLMGLEKSVLVTHPLLICVLLVGWGGAGVGGTL